MNIATLDEAGAKKIIASCPHCFNTIKNEYPALGGNYEVIHHAELLEHLVARASSPPARATGQGDLPRPLLPGPAQPDHRGAALGAERHPRRGADRDAPLQGAGLLLRRRRRPHVAGGEHRQADQHGAHGRGARHGADVVSTACPYCMIMLDDAVRANAKEDDVRVLDLSQLVEESLNGRRPQTPATPAQAETARS